MPPRATRVALVASRYLDMRITTRNIERNVESRLPACLLPQPTNTSSVVTPALLEEASRTSTRDARDVAPSRPSISNFAKFDIAFALPRRARKTVWHVSPIPAESPPQPPLNSRRRRVSRKTIQCASRRISVADSACTFCPKVPRGGVEYQRTLGSNQVKLALSNGQSSYAYAFPSDEQDPSSRILFAQLAVRVARFRALIGHGGSSGSADRP